MTGTYTAPRPHWVGDGFPVRSMFFYQSHVEQLSPFLLLDYAGPHTFTPGNEKCGVGEHPHRGLETVTIVYSDEIEHRDSTGRSGTIDLSDMQWVTVGTRILHEESRLPELTRQGSELETAQLWVNLPAKDEMAVLGYQGIGSDVIPAVALPDKAGSVRAIASSYWDTRDPAYTFSPLNIWDMRLQRDHQLALSQLEGWSTALVVLRGNVIVNDTTSASEIRLVVLSQQGKTLHIEASSNISVLLLPGEPLNEPIVGYGPSIMNMKQEIAEAVRGFNSNRFG